MGELRELAKRALLRSFLFSLVLIAGTFVFVILERSQKEAKKRLEINLLTLQAQLVNNTTPTVDTLTKYAKLQREYWNFQGGLDIDEAFRLSLSIAFTTGWGTYVPTTQGSKVFFLFYSCTGISVATLMLKCIGDIIHELISRSIKLIEKLVLGKSNVKNAHLKNLIVSIVLLILFVALNSLMFVDKGFSTLDAVYDCFQAYTTVGFGDLGGEVKLHDSSHWTVISMFVVNMIGMSLLATLINSLAKYQEIGCCKVQRQLAKSSSSMLTKMNKKRSRSSETSRKVKSESFDRNIGAINAALDNGNI